MFGCELFDSSQPSRTVGKYEKKYVCIKLKLTTFTPLNMA
jgi:hypothetical protein